MPGGIVATAFDLSLFVNHGTNGWSSTWHLFDQDFTSAQATAAELVEAFSWIIAKDHVIEWAEVKRLNHPRAIQAAIGDPLEALPFWDYSDNDATGLLFRFQTGTGKYANHLLRGLEDAEIVNNRWARHPFTLPPGLPVRPADPLLASKADLLRYFLCLFREKTCHQEDLSTGLPGGEQWNLTPWSETIYRKVSSRAYGSSYQRVSGEWHPWERAPDFSYCGTVCGVERACRDTDAYPYVDGGLVVFRTYFALPGATVFPGPTIFFGTYRDQEITNHDAPGEQTGPKKTISNPLGVWEYNGGLAAGIAPGAAPTGPLSRFLGMDLCPYDPDFDTPLEERPACDMPVVNSVRVRRLDGSVDVSDVFEIIADQSTIDLVQVDTHKVRFGAKIPAGSSLIHLADVYTEDFEGATYSRTGDVYTFTTGQPSQIDGIFLAIGDRILFNSGDADAGILEVTALTGGNLIEEAIRAADLDEDSEAIPGFLVMVTNGTAEHDTLWTLTTDLPITINTTPLEFTKLIGVNDLYKVKSRASDPAASYLEDKLVSGIVTMTQEAGPIGDRIRMTIPNARPTEPQGLVSNGTQYFGGDKFFVDNLSSSITIGNPNPDIGISDNIWAEEARINMFAGKQLVPGGSDHQTSAQIRIVQGFATGVYVLSFSPTNPFTPPSNVSEGLGYMLAGDFYTRFGNLPLMVLNQPLGVPGDAPLGLQPSYASYWIGNYDTYVGDSGLLFDGSLVVNGLICRVGNSGATLWGNDQTQVTYGATTGAGADWIATYNFWTSF